MSQHPQHGEWPWERAQSEVAPPPLGWRSAATRGRSRGGAGHRPTRFRPPPLPHATLGTFAAASSDQESERWHVGGRSAFSAHLSGKPSLTLDASSTAEARTAAGAARVGNVLGLGDRSSSGAAAAAAAAVVPPQQTHGIADTRFGDRDMVTREFAAAEREQRLVSRLEAVAHDVRELRSALAHAREATDGKLDALATSVRVIRERETATGERSAAFRSGGGMLASAALSARAPASVAAIVEQVQRLLREETAQVATVVRDCFADIQRRTDSSLAELSAKIDRALAEPRRVVSHGNADLGRDVSEDLAESCVLNVNIPYSNLTPNLEGQKLSCGIDVNSFDEERDAEEEHTICTIAGNESVADGEELRDDMFEDDEFEPQDNVNKTGAVEEALRAPWEVVEESEGNEEVRYAMRLRPKVSQKQPCRIRSVMPSGTGTRVIGKHQAKRRRRR